MLGGRQRCKETQTHPRGTLDKKMMKGTSAKKNRKFMLREQRAIQKDQGGAGKPSQTTAVRRPKREGKKKTQKCSLEFNSNRRAIATFGRWNLQLFPVVKRKMSIRGGAA